MQIHIKLNEDLANNTAPAVQSTETPTTNESQMAAANMYGATVLNGAPVWFNGPAFGHNKMNRPYTGAIEDIAGAFGGMHMYGANHPGQNFNRMNAGYQAGFSSMMPQNAWTNGRYLMPNVTGLPLQHHYPSATSNGFAPGHSLVNKLGQVDHVPDLAIRRSSLSSNEEFVPRTPFFTSQPLSTAAKIGVPDNSPQTWNSISPHGLLAQNGGSPQQYWRDDNRYIIVDFDAICKAAPTIPRPIPAIFSGDKSRGTLETSLENKNETTNVYIRGLHPDTTDEQLYEYGQRFGKIESAKSMIDQHTGLCKGFGFIKYHSKADGENCIRGFYFWGYEAKWARDSHNDKLKKLGDEYNTNLYISNIPLDLDFNEHALMNIFSKYECLSAKILRDPNGLSRGVSFARFASPEVCRAIIAEYNGQPVGVEGQPISIRFADTPDQKKLKAVTQERRQYKTHEYNVAAFGPDSPYSHYGPLVAANSPHPTNRSPLGAQPWLTSISPYTTGASGGNPGVGALGNPLNDNTPLAGRTGPRFTPYPVALNAAKIEVAQDETDAKVDDENTIKEEALAKRPSNLPSKIAGDSVNETPRKLGNAATQSPSKATPIKSSKGTISSRVSNTA